jgi:tetratricopeptide (TPR) repeat protein
MGGLLGAAEFGDIAGVKDSNFYFYGGSAALQIEKWEVAADAFQSCVDLGFNLGASVGYLSTALSKQGKTEEAEKVLQDAVKKAPENLDILIAMINFYIDTDRSADAEKALKAAIVLDPDNTALVYTSGNIYEQMDKIEEAKAAYNRTLELDPNHTNAKFSMGGIYFNKGADLYNEGNKLPPSDPKATQMIEESKELFKKALPYLEDAAEAEPKDVVILESLKAVYGKLGMVEEFKATKARIAELN